MKVKVVSVPVLDQANALAFYTEKLGFVTKHEIPLGGGNRWLTVVAPEDPEGPEVVLEPGPLHFEPARVFQKSLFDAGHPWTQFYVDDLQKEYERMLALGVEFKTEPTVMGEVKAAILNDTCGNYIQLMEML